MRLNGLSVNNFHLRLIIIPIYFLMLISLFFNILISTTYIKVILSTQLYDIFTVDIFPQSSHFAKGSAILQISKTLRAPCFLHFSNFYFSTLDINTTVSTCNFRLFYFFELYFLFFLSFPFSICVTLLR